MDELIELTNGVIDGALESNWSLLLFSFLFFSVNNNFNSGDMKRQMCANQNSVFFPRLENDAFVLFYATNRENRFASPRNNV